MKPSSKIFFILLIAAVMSSAQGKVYIVLGSDTGIWEGLDVSKYYCTYNLGLYTDPVRNTYKIMDPAFRNQFKDSFGRPMKMTWWMMAGNVYRFATNNNIPLPNTMTLYLMKKYHGENAKLIGDELSLHYHTFTWTDYDNDGKYFWNQAKKFTECAEDFDVTLAQFLLEENTFPVSYRSGWHYMDNEWQNYIDKLIPYSLHNDYPAKRTSTVEPIDNVFDWSLASKEYVPFHPSLANYQLPGNGKSWETRSEYMAHVNQAAMDTLFSKAMRGIDQVPCFWAHLPEADFAKNMKRIDSLAHISAGKYPSVQFMYCTATEAMQLWRKGNDTTSPVITIQEALVGENVTFTIQTNENIFQAEPFVAIKDMYEHYSIIHCTALGNNQWTTVGTIPKASIAKISVAVTDTMGNLATASIPYIADDMFLDNQDDTYQELSGTWGTTSTASWGTDSRLSTLGVSDTAVAQWIPKITKSGMYNIYVQVPPIQNRVNSIIVKTFSNDLLIDSVAVNESLIENEWNYITTVTVTENAKTAIQMTTYGKDQTGKIFYADGLKISGLVKDHDIYSSVKQIKPLPVSEEDTLRYLLPVENRGIQSLTISKISTANNFLIIESQFPLIIPGMKKIFVPFFFYTKNSGTYIDTVIIESNDPLHPVFTIPAVINALPYFTIIDNEDITKYSEVGPWAKSVAQIWGASSRYAPSGNNASARFITPIRKNGLYEIFEIVPTTVNAVTEARYVIQNGTDTLSTVTINQNTGSGNWVSIGTYTLSTAAPVSVTVTDKGPASNLVLRADAIKIQILPTTNASGSANFTVDGFSLEQNYPNPFNPNTTIQFQLPRETAVTIMIYDMVGREISAIRYDMLSTGIHTVQFSGQNLSSGMYIYRITAGSYTQSRTMMLLK